MNMFMLIRRITGASPEEELEDARFERNLASADEQQRELDVAQRSLDSILAKVGATQGRIQMSQQTSGFSGQYELQLLTDTGADDDTGEYGEGPGEEVPVCGVSRGVPGHS